MDSNVDATRDDPASSTHHEQRPGPVRHGRALLLFLAGALVVLAGLLSLLVWDAPLTGERNPQTQNAYVDGDVTPLSARVQGAVMQLPVNDNQLVHAGDLIAVIDDSDYRAQLEQAQAQVAVAAANVQSLADRETAVRLQVEQANASVAAARAGLVSDTPEAVRQRTLSTTDAGLGRSVDSAVANAQVTNADVDRAQAQLQAVRSQLDVLAAQRAQAEATLKARQADVALARITLGWTRITAPVDGELGTRSVRVGTLVGPGTEIVSVTPLDTVWVTANFTERQIARIVPGRRATLHVDAFPGVELDGHVVGLSPGTGAVFGGLPGDNTTGNFTKVVQRVPVKIAIDWNGSRLRGLVRPGMSVEARVATDGAPIAPWPTH